MQPLLPQRRPLNHAEAVLLVDDHEPETLELHALLHERVGAQDQVHPARLQVGPHFPARGPLDRARQQRHAKARGRQEPLDVQIVLLGENLGRRHEGHLQAVLHRDDCRLQRDDRLSRPDIPLQQPIHRARLLHVGDDLRQRLFLGSGRLERQHALQRLAHFRIGHHRERLAFPVGVAPAQEQADLEQEELLENQALLRGSAERLQRVERRAFRREMRVLERRAAPRQSEPRQQVRRQHIVEIRRQPIERLPNQRALKFRPDRADLLVHGHDPTGVQAARFLRLVVRAENLVVGIAEFDAAAPVELQLAVQHDAGAARQLVGEVHLVGPRGAQATGLVTNQRLEHLESLAPRPADLCLDDLADDGARLIAEAQRGDRGEPGAVFIAERKAVQQVLDVHQARAAQIRGAAGSDALEKLQRGCEKILDGVRHLVECWPGRARQSRSLHCCTTVASPRRISI